jgi:lipoprotein NlpI
MPTDRLKQLFKFYEEDPNDPFNAYALALEYLKTDPGKSRELFEALLTSHRDYLPTYYHAAQLYIALDDRDKAITVLEDGIALARRLQEAKALRELQTVYDELLFE